MDHSKALLDYRQSQNPVLGKAGKAVGFPDSSLLGDQASMPHLRAWLRPLAEPESHPSL